MSKLTMTIMQGLPGSGKSTIATRLALASGAEVVGADLYPGLYSTGPDGSVHLDFAKLGPAHGACLRSAVEALQAGRGVVVDNTNTTTEEMAPYFLLAQAYGAVPKIVRVACDPDRAHARNTHGVSRQGFDAMNARLTAFKPAPHWQFIPGFSIETIEN